MNQLRGRVTGLGATLSAIGVGMCWVGVCAAQDPFEGRGRVPIEFNGAVVVQPLPAGLVDDFDPDEVTSGASLKTDPELESILEKADRYRADGNYRVATQLWQAVLERSGDTLYSADGQVYLSLVEQVERILSALPPEGLQLYRITADANAREILAADRGGEITALSQVVRQYFLSSEGDEAAFQLASIYLDRFDFIGARRLLEKILAIYPDPSVPLDEVYLRLAVAESYLGRGEAAQAALQRCRELAGEPRMERRIETVAGALGTLAADDVRTEPLEWRLPGGGRQRLGLMPTVSPTMMEGDLVAGWQYYFEPRDHYHNFEDARGRTLVGTEILEGVARDTRNPLETQALQDWRGKEWRPAGELVFSGDLVFFKSAADVIGWNVRAIGQAVAENNAQAVEPIWRSLWRNSFQVDDATLLLRTLRGNYSAYGRKQGIDMDDDSPSSDSEVQLFGDPIYQQMSIQEGVLYSIEGPSFDDRNTHPEVNRRHAPWNASIRRTRANFLSAWDVETGKALWKLPRDPEAEANEEGGGGDWLTSGGFMSAPIQFGNTLIAVVNQGGALSAYGLDPNEEGRTIWKSFLCDEPESSADPLSPINLSLEGSDLFINCGVGVVFVLDPTTGLVRFAKRYPRNGRPDSTFQRMNWSNPRTIYDGWSEDLVIPYGRQMICFGSDSQRIHSFDRNTGELIWYFDRRTHYGLDIDYVLGVYDGVLYAAGRRTIVAIDLKAEGSLLWGGNSLFGDNVSYGRGMLTRDGIYMPVGNSIYHFGLRSRKYVPQLLGQVAVDLGTDAPVGNLFSDGQRFWVHGGNRLYGLWPAPPEGEDAPAETSPSAGGAEGVERP